MRSKKENRIRQRRHSVPLFRESNVTIEHDAFFNNKRKSIYESELAELFLEYSGLFMPLVKKVSNVISADIAKVSIEKDSDDISKKMHHFFLNDYDIKTLFISNPLNDFYKKIISSLKKTNAAFFYNHMCLQFSYIAFFIIGNRGTPELSQASAENWCSTLKLDQLVTDMNKYRNDDVLFQNYQRLKRNYVKNKATKNIGVLPEDSYSNLQPETQRKLSDKLPYHQSGKLLFFMTANCSFTATGMHLFDLPQLCGPSGTTARRLALANQAGLDDDEMELFHFLVAMFNVAIGAHTVDESFMIAQDERFNHYIRGDYTTIIPNRVKTDIIFVAFFQKIQRLNEQYSDILIHSSLLEQQEHLNRNIG